MESLTINAELRNLGIVTSERPTLAKSPLPKSVISQPSMLSRISSYSWPFCFHSSGVKWQKSGREIRYSRIMSSMR